MEQTPDVHISPMGDPVDPIIRFFIDDREVAEQEFLTQHPEEWVAKTLAKMRAESCSRPCLCHGTLSELHVVRIVDGHLEVEIDSCQEESERHFREYRAEQRSRWEAERRATDGTV